MTTEFRAINLKEVQEKLDDLKPPDQRTRHNQLMQGLKEVQEQLDGLKPPDCMMCDDHHLLTDKQLQDVFGITRTTSWRWRQIGLVATYTTVGSGGIRYQVSDVKDFFNKINETRSKKNDDQ